MRLKLYYYYLYIFYGLENLCLLRDANNTALIGLIVKISKSDLIFKKIWFRLACS